MAECFECGGTLDEFGLCDDPRCPENSETVIKTHEPMNYFPDGTLLFNSQNYFEMRDRYGYVWEVTWNSIKEEWEYKKREKI